MRKRTAATAVWRLAVCLAFFAVLHPGLARSAPAPAAISSGKLQSDPGLFNNAFFLMRQFASFSIADTTISRAAFEKTAFVEASLRNVTFSDCDFTHSMFTGGEFNNVTFINCRFTESQFSGVAFDGVSFIGGNFEMLRPGREDKDYAREMFEQHAFIYIRNKGTLLLDGVKLRQAEFFSFEGGSLIFRNMKDFAYHPEYSDLVSGKNLLLRIEDSVISGIGHIARLDAPANVYVVNSTLRDGRILCWARDGKLPNLYAENSQLTQGLQAGKFDTAVLKNCLLGGVIEGENVFFDTPRFTLGNKETHPAFPKAVGSKITVLGGGAEADMLYARGTGEIYIADLRLKTLSVSGKVDSLDLYNLKLDNLDFDDGLELRGGRWENVEIRSPLKAASPGVYSFGTVSLHNTALPGGPGVLDARTPYDAERNKKYDFTTKNAAKSTLPKPIAVPALKELGINL